MASQGPNYAGTGENDASYGSNDWVNPGNITAEDASVSTFLAFGADTSNYLKATNFGFSIPSGATIDGILVEILITDNGGTGLDDRVRIVKGGTISTTDLSTGAGIPNAEAYVSYGGATNLWGESWTDSDINASNFGVVYAAVTTEFTSVQVNTIRVTVYYTSAAGASLAWIVA